MPNTFSACKVFILGSCVSRDALDDGFEIAAYLARTSLASIGMQAVSDDEVRRLADVLPSPFQRKMLLNDLDKTTLSKLAETEHQLLLLDFVDERFDLVLSGPTLFSLSGELEKSGLDVTGRSILSPTSDAFLKLARWNGPPSVGGRSGEGGTQPGVLGRAISRR